jgi:hypothetical protein
VIAAWLRRGGTAEVWLDGPARGVFARALPGLVPLDALPDLARFDFVLCGSSGAADHERRVTRMARQAGVRSAVWLDHWVEYAVRLDTLPDELWVCDEHAARIARATVPGPPVQVRGNPYLEDAAAEIRALAGARGPGERVLYVTEPTSLVAERATGDPLGWGYEERAALRGYLERLAVAPPAELRVRRHPAEPAEKYAPLLAEFGVDPSPGGSLAEDIAWADTVAGCDTMAMVVALAAGRRVVSVIPPGGRQLSLPFAEIERLYPDGQP